MNCQQVTKLLERYDEGELPPQISTQVEFHLRHCVGCQAMLHLVEKERLALQNTADIPALNPEFAQMVMSRISVTPRPKLYPLVPVWVEWTRRYPTLLGAAAVILLFLLPLLGQPTTDLELTPPPTHQAAKKVATLDQSRNVPFNSGISPVTAPSDENSYREETLRPLDPSRSLAATGLGGSDNSPSTPKTTIATGAAATEPTNGTRTVPPTVVPSYIPSGYTLDKIEITSSNQVIVSYAATEDNSVTPLIINIVPDVPTMKIMLDKSDPNSTDQTPEKVEDTPQTSPPVPSATSILPEGNTAPVLGVWSGYNYLITSNIPLDAKEMESLSQSLAPR